MYFAEAASGSMHMRTLPFDLHRSGTAGLKSVFQSHGPVQSSLFPRPRLLVFETTDLHGAGARLRGDGGNCTHASNHNGGTGCTQWEQSGWQCEAVGLAIAGAPRRHGRGAETHLRTFMRFAAASSATTPSRMPKSCSSRSAMHASQASTNVLPTRSPKHLTAVRVSSTATATQSCIVHTSHAVLRSTAPHESPRPQATAGSPA